jgi:hypothetical protein
MVLSFTLEPIVAVVVLLNFVNADGAVVGEVPTVAVVIVFVKDA